MQKKIIRLEIAGIFFVLILSVFMQNLHSLCGRELIGVLFGSVNDSIWESAKTLLLPYALWGMIELLCARPPFRRFVVSKIISLYYLAVSYILLCLIFTIFGSEGDFLLEFTAAIFGICTSLFLSYRLLLSGLKLEPLFLPSFFMFLFFIALYSSFTPFPPKMYIFMDRATRLYGITPEHIDAGAVALDAVYYL